MAFDWRDFLDLAEELQGGGQRSPEAAGRTAVSRAYYAAFCRARNHAAGHLGFQPEQSAGDHGRLRAHLRQQGWSDVAQHLDGLRRWRNQCDYEDEVEGLEPMVGAAIRRARAVLQRV